MESAERCAYKIDRLMESGLMDLQKTVLLLVGMLCVTAVCIFGNNDTAPSAVGVLSMLLSRLR